jgi:hypothetical protein
MRSVQEIELRPSGRFSSCHGQCELKKCAPHEVRVCSVYAETARLIGRL